MSQTVHVPCRADITAMKREPVEDVATYSGLLTVPQVMAYLKVSKWTVYRHVEEWGGWRAGKEYRFRAKDLPGVRREEKAS